MQQQGLVSGLLTAFCRCFLQPRAAPHDSRVYIIMWVKLASVPSNVRRWLLWDSFCCCLCASNKPTLRFLNGLKNWEVVVRLLKAFCLSLFHFHVRQLLNCSIAGVTEWTPVAANNDTYWSGSAPLCVGGCRAQHQELRRDRCGASSCCWLGYKTLCKGQTTAIMIPPLKQRLQRLLLISLVWNVHFFCISVNCGRPDVDYNGVVYGNDWWVGSVARYACRSGFMLVGSPTRSCQPDGRWTPKPICLRECTYISTPPMLNTFTLYILFSLQDCVSRGASRSVRGSWTGPATPRAPTRVTWAHPNTAAPG